MFVNLLFIYLDVDFTFTVQDRGQNIPNDIPIFLNANTTLEINERDRNGYKTLCKDTIPVDLDTPLNVKMNLPVNNLKYHFLVVLHVPTERGYSVISGDVQEFMNS